MKRALYFGLGMLALALGAVGAFVPLLPTVPLVILAAFCFARSSPALERWLVEHRSLGPHILAWRARGAISSKGKAAAAAAFALSSVLALLVLDWPWVLAPLAAVAAGSAFVLSRPTA